MDINTLKKKRFGLISLGCDKNRVEAEKMLGLVRDFGMEIVNTCEDADIVVVNTCAFLNVARLEAINEIAMLSELKRLGKLEKIIVTGCFTKYKDTLAGDIASFVDAFVPIKDAPNIIDVIAGLYGVEGSYECKNLRLLTTPSHIAYLKIADGCNNHCAYCAIPSIRGVYRSVPIEDLIAEANDLVKNGVKELILVAQDVTRYGQDLYGENKLIELLRQLENINGLKWIRLHYCYPEMVTDELINFIAKSKKICNYLDIPLQHISDKILKSMFRRNTKASTLELISKLKSKGIVIRSTFIVGFPGETKEDFKELCDFLKEQKLDFVGFFVYSNEEGTKSFYYPDQVPAKVKEKRLRKVEKIQTKILKQKQKSYIGATIPTIIDEVLDEGLALGRTEYNSYGVDTNIYVIGDTKQGDIVNVRVLKVDEIELIGEC